MKREPVDALKKNKVRLLLDSGAYGAWSRGKELRVKDYAKFCLENKHLIWQLVNLDAIPGQFGRRDNSQREVEVSAKKSYRNQQELKSFGLKPIPVFHKGERLYWLEKMLKEGETYIGLSPGKFDRAGETKRWLDMCFNMLTDKEGRPLVRTHGFSATAFEVMTNYPWRSVDSTTWSLTPGYGQIIIPKWVNGEFDYLVKPTRVIMSGVEQQNKSSQEKQFEALCEGAGLHGKVVRTFIEDVVGSTIEKQRYASIERCRAMLVYYVELCKHLNDVRYTGGRAGLWGPDHYDFKGSGVEARKPWRMILSFATEALHKDWGRIMTLVGANDRLLSYWYLKGRSDDVLERFVIDGTCGAYEQSKLRANWRNESYRNRRRLMLLDHINRSKDNVEDRVGRTSRISLPRVELK